MLKKSQDDCPVDTGGHCTEHHASKLCKCYYGVHTSCLFCSVVTFRVTYVALCVLKELIEVPRSFLKLKS